MSMLEHIAKVRTGLQGGQFVNEAAVSQGILLPTLYELGWPVFNTGIVMPEFSVEGRRVDYALCHPANRPSIFVEVKRVGFSEGADRQLFEYAFHEGVPMAILTDGQEWSFYLPGEQGHYEERRVYKLDVLERDIQEVTSTLNRYLQYSRVCSGEALSAARADYQNVARVRVIESHLPKAWSTLLATQDPTLLTLLAEKVEDLCGYKPDLDACAQFLSAQVTDVKKVRLSKSSRSKSSRHQKHASEPSQSPDPENSKPLSSPQPELPESGAPSSPSVSSPINVAAKGFSFVFKGQTYQAKSARDLMVQAFQRLAEDDESFLERFAARKHGRKRRYLAQDKYDLYPGRPDLAENHACEVVPGWWLGTNYSRGNIQEILTLAIEVSRPAIREQININVLTRQEP
jgi:hypothetical protein